MSSVTLFSKKVDPYKLISNYEINNCDLELSGGQSIFIGYMRKTNEFRDDIKSMTLEYYPKMTEYYLEKKKWIAAINRFRVVVDEFDTTVYTEEALHRLVEIYYLIGLPDEAKKYANLLGYNYKSSLWYEKSYIIFNKIDSKVIQNEINVLKKNFCFLLQMVFCFLIDILPHFFY